MDTMFSCLCDNCGRLGKKTPPNQSCRITVYKAPVSHQNCTLILCLVIQHCHALLVLSTWTVQHPANPRIQWTTCTCSKAEPRPIRRSFLSLPSPWMQAAWVVLCKEATVTKSCSLGNYLFNALWGALSFRAHTSPQILVGEGTGR